MNYRLGLVLSGGASRGFAHAGVLQALLECKLEPEVISGVSAGSIVGALYADGKTPREILKISWQRNIFKFVRFSPRTSGIFKTDGLYRILKDNLKAHRFEDLKIPLTVNATNYLTGQAEYFNSGNLIDAIIASSSIPVLFKPHKWNDTYYIDGGMTDNLPLDPIKNQCEQIIAVNVNPLGNVNKASGLINIAMRSFHISVASNIRNKKKHISYYIEPLELQKYGYLDTAKGLEMFRIGYKEAKKVLNCPCNAFIE